MNSPVEFEADEWWHFGEIRWCPFQIVFLVQNRDLLKLGEWPPEFRESMRSQNVNREGKFVRPVLVLAELEARLERCKSQGEMLITQIDDGRNFHTLSNGAREAIMYCKGFPRKKMGFAKWLRKVYYRAEYATEKYP